jgi:hypothetical protein
VSLFSHPRALLSFSLMSDDDEDSDFEWDASIFSALAPPGADTQTKPAKRQAPSAKKEATPSEFVWEGSNAATSPAQSFTVLEEQVGSTFALFSTSSERWFGAE